MRIKLHHLQRHNSNCICTLFNGIVSYLLYTAWRIITQYDTTYYPIEEQCRPQERIQLEGRRVKDEGIAIPSIESRFSWITDDDNGDDIVELA